MKGGHGDSGTGKGQWQAHSRPGRWGPASRAASLISSSCRSWPELVLGPLSVRSSLAAPVGDPEPVSLLLGPRAACQKRLLSPSGPAQGPARGCPVASAPAWYQTPSLGPGDRVPSGPSPWEPEDPRRRLLREGPGAWLPAPSPPRSVGLYPVPSREVPPLSAGPSSLSPWSESSLSPAWAGRWYLPRVPGALPASGTVLTCGFSLRSGSVVTPRPPAPSPLPPPAPQPPSLPPASAFASQFPEHGIFSQAFWLCLWTPSLPEQSQRAGQNQLTASLGGLEIRSLPLASRPPGPFVRAPHPDLWALLRG